MRLLTVIIDEKEQLAIKLGDSVTLVETINKTENRNFPIMLNKLFIDNQLQKLGDWYNQTSKEKLYSYPSLEIAAISYTAASLQPGKILGVGMNYMETVMELSGKAPEEDPVTFMKPLTSLIGNNDTIMLPSVSNHVTAEGELAIIIGKTCKDVSEQQAPAYVAGLTTAIDVTAKDIHAANPRYLQRSKSFDTFCSIGPEFITLDECSDLQSLQVETIHNGNVIHSNFVSNMMYSPWFIVSFFSQSMTLMPGDIILTGTPGSVSIKNGDQVGCSVSGMLSLKNKVE
ncbi:fumarylacetoacetate hydrolase family protein [Radiobacillus sp. PE A8.2]|uniref:fumarylacetoacetate hydrolase family protein n=1 Tax=Radiobacillus sp. PE A8.2 TaxID=3380349 RepID=UPI00388F21EC